ncbi:MAG: integration host factor subunit beta [Myxococcota bacterium]
MTKSQLIKKLVEKYPRMSVREMQVVINTILDTITEALANNEHVEIRGFGTFSVRNRNPRKARNPKTGSPVQVPQKNTPFFIVGKELRERINASALKVPIKDFDNEDEEETE